MGGKLAALSVFLESSSRPGEGELDTNAKRNSQRPADAPRSGSQDWSWKPCIPLYIPSTPFPDLIPTRVRGQGHQSNSLQVPGLELEAARTNSTHPNLPLPRFDIHGKVQGWGSVGVGGTSERQSPSPRTAAGSCKHNYARPFPQADPTPIHSFRGGEYPRETETSEPLSPAFPGYSPRSPATRGATPPGSLSSGCGSRERRCWGLACLRRDMARR